MPHVIASIDWAWIVQAAWQAAVQTAMGCWQTLGEMAPYLLFGFLVAGLLSVLIPPRLVEKHLGGRGPWPVIKAAAFGVPLPLCSCGVIPVAASLRRHGASRGAATAFLLSTPQTGVDSIAVTYSLLGGVFAVFRPIAALVTGVVGGWLVAWFDPARKENGGGGENLVCEDECCVPGEKRHPLVRIAKYGLVTLPRDIGGSLLIGLLVAGIISAAVPKDYFSQYLGPGPLQMLVMMGVGIPVYVCATASVPIALALIAAGISPGAALCFLVTGPATNAATITTLWKVMGRRTTAIYLATVAGCALVSGIVLDLIYSHAGAAAAPHVHEAAPNSFEVICSIVLLGVLGFALVPKPRRRAAPVAAGPQKALLSIVGMTCSHCVEAVTRALRDVAGVASAVVDLDGGWAVVQGAGLDSALLVSAVADLGYTATVVEGPGVNAPALRTLTLKVEGMTCGHCAEHVQKALEALGGVAAAEVDLKAGQAKVWGQHLDLEALVKAVSQAGYSASVAEKA